MDLQTPIILASASPRRAQLLAQIRIPFEAVASAVDESIHSGELPEDYVCRMARSKAAAGSRVGRITLAADTIVVTDNRILGKPAGREEAIEMLLTLAGREHRVHTAVAVCNGDRLLVDLVSTRVRFRDISAEEAQRYWESGEPVDKAGGYGIQGIGGIFAASIEGSYSAVVGLPLTETERLLAQMGVDTWRCRTDG
ncbi:MAG: nucleoside triphosphate pyrophosphatase [Pseudomonadales bacterium]